MNTHDNSPQSEEEGRTDAPRTVDCETVLVIVRDENGRETGLMLPAFTRTLPDFRVHVMALLDNYMDGSRSMGSKPSTADFVLYLVTVAAAEPRTQTATDDTEATD